MLQNDIYYIYQILLMVLGTVCLTLIYPQGQDRLTPLVWLQQLDSASLSYPDLSAFSGSEKQAEIQFHKRLQYNPADLDSPQI